MTLLDIDPLVPTTAISEMVIILIGAALIGYLIGRWITKGKISTLENELVEAENKLSACNEQHILLSKADPVVPDNLKLIEGIGPKIEALLNSANIFNFKQLAEATEEQLLNILHSGGERFQMHNPSTWPAQASMARDGEWAKLEEWQNQLNGGKIN